MPGENDYLKPENLTDAQLEYLKSLGIEPPIDASIKLFDRVDWVKLRDQVNHLDKTLYYGNMSDDEIRDLLANASFSVTDRIPSVNNNAKFYMLQSMSVEDMVTATAEKRREIGDEFIQRLGEHPIVKKKEEDLTPDEKKANRASAEFYGALFRNAGDRLREYKIPDHDFKDYLFWVTKAEEINAVSNLLIDHSQNQQYLNKRDGFLDAYSRDQSPSLESGGTLPPLPPIPAPEGIQTDKPKFNLDRYDAPLGALNSFVSTISIAYGIAVPGNDSMRSAYRVAAMMFLESYGDMFRGRTCADICDGMGTREIGFLRLYKDLAPVHVMQKMQSDPAFRQKCEAYLNGEGERPMPERELEEVVGYIHQNGNQKSFAETVGERRFYKEGMGHVDDQYLDALNETGRYAPASTSYFELESLKVSNTAEPALKGIAIALSTGSKEAAEKDAAQYMKLANLEKGVANPDLRKDGARYFDEMFGKMSRGDAGLGDGDWEKAHSIYGEMGISSPVELFYVDGRPITEYVGSKYGRIPGGTGRPFSEEYSNILKTEIMAAVTSGRHHVEFAKAEVDQRGNFQIGVSELQVDLHALDGREGFFQRKKSGLAERMWNSDKNQKSRQDGIRQQFGSKLVAGATRALNTKKPMEEAKDKYNAEKTSVQDIYFTEKQKQRIGYYMDRENSPFLDEISTFDLTQEDLCRLAQNILMAENPDVRFADLTNPNSFRAEKLAAGQKVMEALYDRFDKNPPQYDKINEIVKQSMTVTANLDARKEILYALGQPEDLSPEAMTDIMKRAENVPKVNALLGAISKAAARTDNAISCLAEADFSKEITKEMKEQNPVLSALVDENLTDYNNAKSSLHTYDRFNQLDDLVFGNAKINRYSSRKADVENDLHSRYKMIAGKMITDRMKEAIVKNEDIKDFAIVLDEEQGYDILSEKLASKLQELEQTMRIQQNVPNLRNMDDAAHDKALEEQKMTVSDVGQYLFGTTSTTQLLNADLDQKGSMRPGIGETEKARQEARERAIGKAFGDALKEYNEGITRKGNRTKSNLAELSAKEELDNSKKQNKTETRARRNSVKETPNRQNTAETRARRNSVM